MVSAPNLTSKGKLLMIDWHNDEMAPTQTSCNACPSVKNETQTSSHGYSYLNLMEISDCDPMGSFMYSKGKQGVPCFEDDLFQQDDLDRPESCFVDRPEDVALMFDEYRYRDNRDVNDRNNVQEVDEEVVEREQLDDEEACDQNDEQQTEGDVSDFEHAARDMPTPDTPVDMGGFNFQLDANIQDNRREAAKKLHPVDAVEQEAPSIPMEELESADEADVEDGPTLRKRRLKVIRRAYKGKYKFKEGYFRVHDEFVTRKEATDKIKMHALQVRRAISVIQCDNNRVRAKCFGTVLGESSFNPVYAKEGSKPSTSKKRGRFEKTQKQKDLKCKGVSPRGHLIKNHKPLTRGTYSSQSGPRIIVGQ